MLVVVRINLIKSFNNIDLVVTSIFDDEISLLIKELSEKMLNDGMHKYFTINHELDARSTVVFLESWVKETDEDKSNALGIDEPIGTLFMKARVESDLIWDSIKDGKLNGFSIELDASMIKTNFKKMDFTKILKNTHEIEDGKLLFNSLEMTSF